MCVLWVWNGVGQEIVEFIELHVREYLAQRGVVPQRRFICLQLYDLLLHHFVFGDQDVDILELRVKMRNLSIFVGDLLRLLKIILGRSNTFLLEMSFPLLVWNLNFNVIIAVQQSTSHFL